jgi:hypothetical protein
VNGGEAQSVGKGANTQHGQGNAAQAGRRQGEAHPADERSDEIEGSSQLVNLLDHEGALFFFGSGPR